MRAHVVLPEDLVAEVDRIAGKRKRSEFIEEAVRERVRREKLRDVLKRAAGSMNPADYPEWSTPEKTSKWVHDMRRADDKPIRYIEPKKR
jgi:metal-responsive CopG/Arc/MetJ family transcriptional regulator